MRWLLILLLLTGCSDRYRYKCQDPNHFQDAECQRPKCLFTQQCSDYLVAPILEKQVVQQQTQPPSDK
ncbi:hypothetical protein [Caudoviricetes sp.]|nr:hypothetical protein [Caudoviricetes sp.]UOF78389.1 hypothetical protein [Bacteriophage sp.]